MARFKSFDTERFKLPKLWEDEEGNRINIFKLPKFEINFTQVDQLKKKAVFNIASDILLSSELFPLPTGVIFEKTFPNLPDDFIRFSRLVVTYKTTDGFDMDEIFDPNFDFIELDWWWKRVKGQDENVLLGQKETFDMILKVRIEATFQIEAPIFADINLIILNERIYHEIQSNKE